MIVQLLCFLMMMVVSVVVCAPGQNIVRQNMVLADDDSKATEQVFRVVDPLGGGNLVLSDKKDQTKESFVSPENNALNSLMLSSREDKPKHRHMSSGTLDPLGGGHLLKATDPVELFVNYQDDIPQNAMLQARVDKPKQRPSSSGTFDPLGGGNFVRAVDLAQDFRTLESFLKHQENIPEARKEEATSKPSSSGTLDPIGGGNLIRVADPYIESQNFGAMELLFSYQDDIPVERKDKSTPRPSSSGTLDSIGGGNLLRVVDPNTETQNFREMEFLVGDQGRQNMMRLAREDKSSQRSAHALDSLGSGRVVGVVDPYRGNQIFRSLDRNHLLDSLDNYQGGEVLRVLDALTGSDLISSLDSAEGVAVLSALKKTRTKHPKRMLDSVSGWAFGESKRNFDEIDNVGFTGFAKKSPSPYYRKQYEALAKKNFDEIDRAGFETYNKRDFDEIDRTGFETFEKRDRKE